jgi:hypothetical protein
MSYCRLFLLPALAGFFLLLISANGAVGPPLAPGTPTPSLPPLPFDTTADPAADQLLDQAVARLAPARREWVAMKLWQHVCVQGLSYEAEGSYLSGPENQLRLELKTHQGSVDGRLLVVSDGTTLWQHLCVGDESRDTFKRMNLREVLDVLDDPGMPAGWRDQFLQTQAFGAVTALLPNLRQRMNGVKRETVRREGRLLHRLTAVWKPEVAAALRKAEPEWPAGLARQCRLYLDAATLWPHRLEWWGPDPPQADDSLLVQMEFRDPVLNQPLSAERCASEFQVLREPETAADVTADVTQRLKDRAKKAGRPDATLIETLKPWQKNDTRR